MTLQAGVLCAVAVGLSGVLDSTSTGGVGESGLNVEVSMYRALAALATPVTGRVASEEIACGDVSRACVRAYVLDESRAGLGSESRVEAVHTACVQS